MRWPRVVLCSEEICYRVVVFAAVYPRQAVENGLSQAGGQLPARDLVRRMHRCVEDNVDPGRGLSEHSQQVAVELVVTNEGRQMVGAPVPSIGDGDGLDRRFAFRCGLEQQAVERQYGQTCAGGSFRVDQDILSGLQIPDNPVPDAAGLAASPPDEKRAGLPCQPAYDRPLADLGFRQEPDRCQASQNRNI